MNSIHLSVCLYIRPSVCPPRSFSFLPLAFFLCLFPSLLFVFLYHSLSHLSQQKYIRDKQKIRDRKKNNKSPYIRSHPAPRANKKKHFSHREWNQDGMLTNWAGAAKGGEKTLQKNYAYTCSTSGKDLKYTTFKNFRMPQTSKQTSPNFAAVKGGNTNCCR